MVAWWKKLRKAWTAVTARRRKSRKGKDEKSNMTEAGGNPSNDTEELESGFMTLKRDVENCDCEDVHGLWNILMTRMNHQRGELVAAAMKPSSSSTASSSAADAAAAPPPPPPPSPSPSLGLFHYHQFSE